MAVIATEEAAGRLARVILSDVELYARERPKSGENLESQIEEGRRLFASRVTPEMLPVFDAVLAARKMGAASPAPAAAPIAPVAAAPAVPAPVVAAPIAAAPVVTESVVAAPGITEPVVAAPAPVAIPPDALAEATDQVEAPSDDITAPGGSEVDETIHNQVTRPTASAEPAREPTPQPMMVAAPVVSLPPVLAPAPAASPPPVLAPTAVSSPPVLAAPAASPDVAPTPAAPLAAKPASPSGPVPTLKVRVSIPKIALSLAVAAGLLAVIAHYVR